MDEDDILVTLSSSLLTHIDPISSLSGPSRNIVNYFYQASELKQSFQHCEDIPCPLRTSVCSSQIAFHLGRDPSYKRLLVDEVAKLYCIPDLCPALGDYLQHITTGEELGLLDVRGRRLSPKNCDLPFDRLEVWKKVYLQSKAYHHPHTVLPDQSITALPPSLGQFDNAIMNVDPTKEWPFSGLNSVSLTSIVSNASS